MKFVKPYKLNNFPKYQIYSRNNQGYVDRSGDTRAGPALASAGPDWKHFCGAPLSGVCRTF